MSVKSLFSHSLELLLKVNGFFSRFKIVELSYLSHMDFFFQFILLTDELMYDREHHNPEFTAVAELPHACV